MRSILLVSAASRAAFDAALASEADALAIDLAYAAPRQAESARKKATALIAEAREKGRVSLAQIHPLASDLADADLDAVMAARPAAIVLPDACGGRDVQHLGAKLAVREAENAYDDGSTKILALGADSPAALFELGSFVRATRRLIGLGRDEALLARTMGVEARGKARAAPLDLARNLCLFAAAAAGVPAFDCADPGEGAAFARACETAARDGFSGKFALTPEQARTINTAFAGKKNGAAIDAFG